MSPRTGRPKAVDPIKYQITVRLNATQMQQLEAYCKSAGITKGEGVRRGVQKLLDKQK